MLLCWSVINSDSKPGYLGWYAGQIIYSDSKIVFLGWYAGQLIYSDR